MIKQAPRPTDKPSIAFQALAANVLRFLSGGQDVDLYESAWQFIEAFEPIKKEGGPIHVFDLTPYPGHMDEHINTALTGALIMVAGALSAPIPNPEYEKGRDQLSRGVVLIHEKARTLKR